MRRRLLPWAAAFALLAGAGPAAAGIFDDDEARRQIQELRRLVTEQSARIEKLERIQLDNANQFEQMRSDIARVRGDAEVAGHNIEQTDKRSKDLYVDIDSRLRKLESSAAAAAGSAAAAAATPSVSQSAAAPASGDPASETRQYEAALNQFRTGNYMGSVVSFQDFIKAYPGSRYLPNAHYWTANAYVQLRNYDKAYDQFNRVITSYPDDAKAPDAMLGLSSAQDEAGQAATARKTLETLVSRYPTSSAAQLAKQRLARKR